MARPRRRRPRTSGGHLQLRLAYRARAPPPPHDACRGSGCLACRRWAHLLREGDPAACRRWARLHPNFFSVHRPFWNSLNEQEEQKTMKEKRQAKPSAKRKARWTGPHVIVDDEIKIPGDIYMTWLEDPSSLVSKRRRVSTKIKLFGKTKIGDIINLPLVAPVSYSNSLELYYPKELMQLWKESTEAKSPKPSSPVLHTGEKPSQSAQEQQPRNSPSQPQEEFQKEMGTQPMDTDNIEKITRKKSGLTRRSASSSGGSGRWDSLEPEIPLQSVSRSFSNSGSHQGYAGGTIRAHPDLERSKNVISPPNVNTRENPSLLHIFCSYIYSVLSLCRKSLR